MLAHQIPVILGGGFDPSVIFAEMQGSWLEPRIGGMWQENTGVTPTTSGGQTIGLLLSLDNQQQLGTRLETNGDFSNGTTGWSAARGGALSVVSGALRVTGAGGTQIGASSTITCVVGSLYYFTATYNVGTAASMVLRAASDQNLGTPVISSTYTSGSGVFTGYFFATAATMYVGCISTDTGAGKYIEIDNISVQQAIGNHASQATAANRPTLQYTNGLPLVRCDSNDFMTVYLPNLGSGVFSNSGSVYFAIPSGMSALHNQSIGTSYSAPIQSMDLYGAWIVPSRLSDQREAQLQAYCEKLAGLR